MAERLAVHELERIRKLAKDRGLHGGLLAHVAACVTLSGGSSREDLSGIIAEERSALGYGDTDAVPDLVKALWDALPVTEEQALSPILFPSG